MDAYQNAVKTCMFFRFELPQFIEDGLTVVIYANKSFSTTPQFKYV